MSPVKKTAATRGAGAPARGAAAAKKVATTKKAPTMARVTERAATTTRSPAGPKSATTTSAARAGATIPSAAGATGGGGVGPFGWAIAPRAPGERRYWLAKSEPDVFSFDDLLAAPDRTTCWDGVRNYTARNLMRDGMRVGDLVLFYHSNAEPSGVAGIAEVVREAYPDPTQFDPRSDYFDASAKREAPTWVMVDVRAVEKLPAVVTLEAMRGDPALEGLETVRRGSRLSVHPVSAGHFARIAGRP